MKPIIAFLLLFAFTANAQDPLGSLEDLHFFSDAIRANIKLYKVNSQVANERFDVDRTKFLYDSLVKNCLVGTQFDNFLVNHASGQPVYFEYFDKPIYLRTTSRWCEPNASEAAAFNDIAKEFSDLIDFVVLYWDTQATVAEASKAYSGDVSIIYVDELENYNSDIIDKIKHSLGLPTIFLMDQSRNIIDIRKGATPKFTPTPGLEVTTYGDFNPKASKEHFINSYGVYFEQMTEDVNSIIKNM